MTITAEQRAFIERKRKEGFRRDTIARNYRFSIDDVNHVIARMEAKPPARVKSLGKRTGKIRAAGCSEYDVKANAT